MNKADRRFSPRTRKLAWLMAPPLSSLTEGLLKSPSMRARSRGQPANDHTRRTLVFWPVATTRSSHWQLHTNRRHAHAHREKTATSACERPTDLQRSDDKKVRVPIDTIRVAVAPSPRDLIRWETEAEAGGAGREPGRYDNPAPIRGRRLVTSAGWLVPGSQPYPADARQPHSERAHVLSRRIACWR